MQFRWWCKLQGNESKRILNVKRSATDRKIKKKKEERKKQDENIMV